MTQSNGEEMTKKDQKSTGSNPFQTVFSGVNLNIDKAQVIHNAFVLLSEAQRQAGKLKKGVQSEMDRFKSTMESAYGDIGSVVSAQSKFVKDQTVVGMDQLLAQWESNKSKLPPIVTNEVDGLLKKVGLTKQGKSEAKVVDVQVKVSPVKAKPKTKTKGAVTKKASVTATVKTASTTNATRKSPKKTARKKSV